MLQTEAAAYRRRATHLRSLAARLRATPSMTLHVHGGVGTWHGPRADECMADLGRAQQRMRDAADELVTRAFHLERDADELTLIVSRAERIAGLDRT